MRITVGKRTILAKTCPLCGEFKMADQFGVLHKYYRASYCRRCHNVHGRPKIREHQLKALDVAHKHRRPWTEDDIDKMRQMIHEGLSGAQMALQLRRTLYAVYTMKNRLLEETT